VDGEVIKGKIMLVTQQDFKQSPFLGFTSGETRKPWGQKLWPYLHLSFSYSGNVQHLER